MNRKRNCITFSILKDQDLFRLINFFSHIYYIINVLIEQGGKIYNRK